MMSPSAYSDDDFFDEDGNLIATSWQIDQYKEEKERSEQEAQEADKTDLRQVNRRLAIDERVADFEKNVAESQRRRKIREEWLSLPEWIKNMPRTPMSDPPTEGRKEMFNYRLRGKVTLTDEERNRRINQMKRIKLAIQDYETIHRPFPEKTPMNPVAVIPVGKSVGGTMISRGISRALRENRLEYGVSTIIDLGSTENRLPMWYENANTQRTNMKFILKYIRETTGSLRFMSETFSMGGDGEYYIFNHSSPERRINPTMRDVADLYRYIRPTSGVAIFDCDRGDMDSLIAATALAKTRIFVLPIAKDAPELLMELLDDIKESLGEERYRRVIDNSILVISGLVPTTGTPKGKKALQDIIEKCSDVSGIDPKRSVIVSHDPALVRPPMPWGKLRFSTAHSFRWLAGRIISDVLGEPTKNNLRIPGEG